MAVVRIEFPEWDTNDPPSALNYFGTEVYLDGQRISGVTNLELRVTVGEPVSLTIDAHAVPEFVEVPAEVTINVLESEDYPEAVSHPRRLAD